MKKIYIGNLSRQTTEEALEAAFGAFGTVQSVAIIRDRYTGDSRGFGFIEMDNQEEATAAITGLNETQLDGRTVTVNEARPRAERPGGGGGGGSRGSGGRERRY